MTTTTATCSACRAPLAAPARYCHRCGRAVAGHGAAARAPWIVAWCLVALSLALILWFVLVRVPAAARADMANAGNASGAPAPSPDGAGGTPPDISRMTPEQRFLRLSDRIMSSLERGDTSALARFAPMAVSAYRMLEQPDPDLRYHAGVLFLRMGEPAAALALADTIARAVPDHLLADLLRAETAQARGDRALLDRSRGSFLAHFDGQMASGRPEYLEHREMLEEFRRQARR